MGKSRVPKAPCALALLTALAGSVLVLNGCNMYPSHSPQGSARDYDADGDAAQDTDRDGDGPASGTGTGTGGGRITCAQLNAAIFTPHCSSCHSFNRYASATASAETIYQMVSSGRMPPTGALPASYANAIEQWIQEGMPQ